MQVLITTPQGAFLRPYEHAYVPLAHDELRLNGAEHGLVLEDDPARADLIVFLESAESKTVDYLKLLERDALVRAHADRVFTINYEDHPEGALAGCYTSLTAPLFDSSLHRIWPVLLMNNPLVYELSREELFATAPSRLFSFTGAASHALRKRLFELYPGNNSQWHVQQINRWYNHENTDRRHFINIALDSWFCLCPRGYTDYTHRIAEIMCMGRVPVIIADEWIPFSLGEGSPYYIRVAERDIAHLPDILSAQLKNADEYRRNARAIWEKNCSLRTRTTAAIQCLGLLAQTGTRLSYAAYRERWNSKTFLESVGWTVPQRVALRLEQHVRRWFPAAALPGVTPIMRARNASFGK